MQFLAPGAETQESFEIMESGDEHRCRPSWRSHAIRPAPWNPVHRRSRHRDADDSERWHAGPSLVSASVLHVGGRESRLPIGPATDLNWPAGRATVYTSPWGAPPAWFREGDPMRPARSTRRRRLFAVGVLLLLAGCAAAKDRLLVDRVGRGIHLAPTNPGWPVTRAPS